MRILIDVSEFEMHDEGGEIDRVLKSLADELNSALDEYEVMLGHLDTCDYLVFTPRAVDEAEDEPV